MIGDEKSKYGLYKLHCINCKILIFSKEKRALCSRCFTEVNDSDSVPYNPPFTKLKPKCLLVTLSFGSFDPKTYTNSEILHVGLSNSAGTYVYNFWNQYRADNVKDTTIWKSVINIDLKIELSDKEWDEFLEKSLTAQRNSDPKYHQIDNNCYDYICRAFNELKYKNIIWNKQNLAAEYIEGPIIELERFCKVYKIVDKEGESVQEENYNTRQVTLALCDICSEYILNDQRLKCTVCQDFDMCLTCYKSKGHEHKMIEK